LETLPLRRGAWLAPRTVEEALQLDAFGIGHDFS
jgi:hypothetical protein